MKLVDTSVAIDQLRGYQPATDLLEGLIRSEQAIAASELTRFELLAGARFHEHDELEALFSLIDWAPVTTGVSRKRAEYYRTYRRSHSGIDTVDYVIAGTAHVLGANLVTINIKHFPMFDQLSAPYSYY